MKYNARRTLITASSIIALAATAFAFAGETKADAIIDPYYAGGALGVSSVEIDNTVRISTAGLHANPIGGKLLIGARPLSYFGGEFELIDFGRGIFRSSGDVTHSSSLDLAAAAFIVGYLPLAKRQVDLFAKIGAAVYRSQYKYAGDFSNTCVVTTTTGNCTPLTELATSGTNTEGGFAYGVGIQYHVGHYAIRAEYERIASARQPEEEAPNTTRVFGLSLASLGVTYGF